jgi:hypothetical protein
VQFYVRVEHPKTGEAPMHFAMEAWNQVRDLKKAICRVTDIAPLQQELTYFDKVLEDDYPMEVYAIRAGDSLKVRPLFTFGPR